MMTLLIAFIGAAIVALVLWKVLNASDPGDRPTQRPAQGPSTRPRVSGPDDDPDFLRQLDEKKTRKREDPPSA
jgi:hypothetical protein